MTKNPARIVVVGGGGFFGAAAVELLWARGMQPVVASRRGADLRLDVEDRQSLRAGLRPGDVVIDAAGPFQERTTGLVEAACEVGCHVVDISDSLDYAERVAAAAPRIERAGIAVLNSSSSVSAVSAALVRLSGVADPVRVSGFLAPASRYSASQGTAASLLRSVGRDIRVFRGGRLVAVPGWRERKDFDLPAPHGRLQGRLFESADSYWLPRAWPSLRSVDFYIDSRVPGFNTLLSAATTRPWLRRLLERYQAPGRALTRWLGSKSGCLGVEVEAANGGITCHVLVPQDRGHLVAVAPAILAAGDLATGQFAPRGLVRPDQQVDAARLIDYLATLGVERLAPAPVKRTD